MAAAQSTPEVKDLEWIKRSLQSAVELEFSTLPLYLSAMFSLEVQNYTAYNIIRSVAMEEMVHMSIAANILAAIGGTPAIKHIRVAYPTQGLPGGCEPDLHIGLANFSKNQLKNFMRIEVPECLVSELALPAKYPTIGVFYKNIKSAIRKNADAVREAAKKGGTSNQVGDNIGFTKFLYDPAKDPVKMFCTGINEILEQGEGADAKDLLTSPDFETEESHYAKFAELYYGATYKKPKGIRKVTKANEAKFFSGTTISWPKVINTLCVPKDGYAKILALDPQAKEVAKSLDAFDAAFSEMMLLLDNVWNGPAATSWKTLGAAVHKMVDFRVLSCFNIMRYEIPADIIKKLPALYPDEYDFISQYTNLKKPVFYGPRFINNNK
jgi:Ferritin-like